MKYGFSDDVACFRRSPARDLFKKYDLSKMISFAGGYPSPLTFPVEQLKKITSTVLDNYGAQALQYGATEGINELRQVLAKRSGVDVKNLQITTSSQQAIDLCTRIMINPGDVILCANPSYLGALQSFYSYRADIQSIDSTDDASLLAERYEKKINSLLKENKKIKFIYSIPDFNNPTGETLNLECRKVLVAIAKKYDILILEDCPYREVRFEGEQLPSMYSMDSDIVVQLGSFSKIFAPGIRLGWVIGAEEFLDKLTVCKQSTDLCSPIINQYLAAEYLRSGELDKNLVNSLKLYRHKRDTMLRALEKYMPEGSSWTHPEGGLFIFLYMPEGMSAVDIYEKVLNAGVAYVAGEFFHCDGKGQNTIRLNFSFTPEEKIDKGIQILANCIKD